MGKAATRVYIVDNGNQKWLVRAYSSVQARSHVTEKTFTVEVAKQDTLIELLGAGVKVLDAGKPETVDAFEGNGNEHAIDSRTQTSSLGG